MLWSGLWGGQIVSTAQESDNLTQLGLAIYETKLKPLLEPQEDGKFVAIHVDTEDFAVAPASGQATRALLQRHPIDGRIIVRKIGSEPEYSLLTRMIAGELMAQPREQGPVRRPSDPPD